MLKPYLGWSVGHNTVRDGRKAHFGVAYFYDRLLLFPGMFVFMICIGVVTNKSAAGQADQHYPGKNTNLCAVVLAYRRPTGNARLIIKRTTFEFYNR